MLKKLERGMQLGIEKRIEKKQKYFWYMYAVQKRADIYYVYECEIAEENMAQELFEYEKVNKYLSLDEVIQNFPCKYDMCFEDIHTLKGQKIFNVSFYV